MTAKKTLIYAAMIFLPIVIMKILDSFMELNYSVIHGLFVNLGILFGAELLAKVQSDKFLWAYISNSGRDKVAFSIALFSYCFIFAILGNANINIPFYVSVVVFMFAIGLGLLIFSIFATRQTRGVLLNKVFSWLKSR